LKNRHYVLPENSALVPKHFRDTYLMFVLSDTVPAVGITKGVS